MRFRYLAVRNLRLIKLLQTQTDVHPGKTQPSKSKLGDGEAFANTQIIKTLKSSLHFKCHYFTNISVKMVNFTASPGRKLWCSQSTGNYDPLVQTLTLKQH